eukprot:COSAG06_NODE_207_length_20219_cov_8.734841_8_plen_223_part_00
MSKTWCGAVRPNDTTRVNSSDPSRYQTLVLPTAIVIDAFVASSVKHDRGVVRQSLDLVCQLCLQLVVMQVRLKAHLPKCKLCILVNQDAKLIRSVEERPRLPVERKRLLVSFCRSKRRAAKTGSGQTRENQTDRKLPFAPNSTSPHADSVHVALSRALDQPMMCIGCHAVFHEVHWNLEVHWNGLFWSFLYVCPEPVLVKCSFLYINGSKGPFLLTLFAPLA